MCTGVELLFLAAAGTGAAVSVYGQQQAAQQAQESAAAQAKQIAVEAGQAQDATNAQAERIRRAAAAQAGEATAALSASGVSVADGTAVKIAEQIYKDSESDALNAIISGNRGANSLSEQGRQILQQGKDARRAANMNSVGTVLGTAASALKASGWRSNGPGWAGTQAPAPVSDRSIRVNG